MQIGGLTIGNTSKLVDKDTRLCMHLWAPTGYRKTRTAATLNNLTKKFLGKPTLFVACESCQGGGTMSIQDFGVDFVQPKSKEDLDAIIAALYNDTTYGGVAFDSFTEIVKQFYQPYALKFPNLRDKDAAATRAAGVPAQSDYQTMGEVARTGLVRIIGLTTVADLNVRKHIIVTALEKTKEDRKTQAIIRIGPDLPGAMADTAPSMFQTSANIQARQVLQKDKDGKPERVTKLVLVTEDPGPRLVKDRMGVFPAETECLDLCELWERFVVSKFSQVSPT